MNTQGDDPLNDDNDSNQTAFHPEVVWGFIGFHRRRIIGAALVFCVGYFLWSSLARDDSRKSKSAESTEVSPAGEKSTDVLLESVIQAGDLLRTQPPPSATSTLQGRLKSIETLLSRSLSPSQQEYCHAAKIESVGALFNANEQGKLELGGTEEAIQEIDRQYSNHDAPLLAAKANLICLRVALYKYIVDKIDIDQLNAEVESRKESICRSPVTISSFAVLLVKLSQVTTDVDDVRKICLRNLRYIGEINEDISKKLAVDILLSELDLPSLAVRVRQEVDGADQEVAQLFDSLSQYSNFPVVIYSIAASTIRSHQIIGERERAEVLLGRLKEIEPTITFDDVRTQVQRGIQMLEASARE